MLHICIYHKHLYLQNSGVREALLDFLLQRAYFLYIFLTVHIFCVIV